MSYDEKILEVLGRAATDHRFCRRLLKDPSKACRSYGLSESSLDRLKRLLTDAPVHSTSTMKLATAARISLAALLLSSSLAFATGPSAQTTTHQAPRSSQQAPSVRDDGEHGDGGASIKRAPETSVHQRSKMPQNDGMSLERQEALPDVQNDRDLPVDSVLRKRPGSPRELPSRNNQAKARLVSEASGSCPAAKLILVEYPRNTYETPTCQGS